MIILWFIFFIQFPYPAVAAGPVLAETGGTEQVTEEDDLASKPAAGAATAAGCPATKTQLNMQHKVKKVY